jgi:hypothetical protein
MQIETVFPDLPGDYNFDGAVDAADYVLWRTNDGSVAGYEAWRDNFGGMAGVGNGSGASAVVPEPAALMILAVALAIAPFSIRRRR